MTPRPSWAPRALEWSRQGQDDPTVLAWISQALRSKAWDSAPWFDELKDQENVRLKSVFAQWGNADLEVSNETAAPARLTFLSLASLPATNTSPQEIAYTF